MKVPFSKRFWIDHLLFSEMETDSPSAMLERIARKSSLSIEPVLYNQETNQLLSQADSFRDEIEALKNEVSGDVTKVTETTALIHFCEKSAMLQEFDEDLFERFVKRIIVHSRSDIRFELKCGLTLKERM